MHFLLSFGLQPHPSFRGFIPNSLHRVQLQQRYNEFNMKLYQMLAHSKSILKLLCEEVSRWTLSLFFPFFSLLLHIIYSFKQGSLTKLCIGFFSESTHCKYLGGKSVRFHISWGCFFPSMMEFFEYMCKILFSIFYMFLSTVQWSWMSFSF